MIKNYYLEIFWYLISNFQNLLKLFIEVLCKVKLYIMGCTRISRNIIHWIKYTI